MDSEEQGPRRRGWPARYGFAAMTILVAHLILRIPVVGPGLGTVVFVACLLSAWYGGAGPGLFAAALLDASLIIVIHHDTGGMLRPHHYRDLATIFLVAVIIVALVEALHRALRRAEAAGREVAARAAEEARRKDEFLAMLGHELRNPLAAIANAVRLLASPEAAEDHDWARAILGRQVHQLTRLVDDLLDASRIGRGKIRLDWRRVDLADVVRSAAGVVRPMIEARRHELRLSIADVPIAVDGDPTRLEQVVVNLLNNAAKYTEPGGRIDVEAACEGAEAVIRVADTGIGIAPEMLPRVFELFAQADRSLDRSQGGLGIGLGMVQRLVEMHGGRVEAHSEGQGRGSAFTVRLPIAGSSTTETQRHGEFG